MTVVRPNSISGINSITVATGEALSIHGADGALVSTLTNTSGIATYKGIHVGSGTTTSNQGVIVGTGASIVSDAVNELSIYTNNAERLLIDSVGRHGINVTNICDYYSAADDLVIKEKDGGDTGITLRTGTANSGLICFADGASSTSDQYRRGQIRYHHNSDSMDFTTAGNTARITIDSSGKVGINQDTPTEDLEVKGDTTATIFINAATHDAGTANEAQLKLGYNQSHANDSIGYVKLIENGTNSYDGVLTFGVPYNNSGTPATREALRITQAGRVGIATDTPGAYLDIGDNLGSVPGFHLRNHPAAAPFEDVYLAEIRHAYGTVKHAMLIHAEEADDARRVLDISDSNGIFATFTNHKVGFGTQIPATEFEVFGGGTVANFKGTGGAGSIQLTDVNNGKNLFLQNADGVFNIQTSGSSYSNKVSVAEAGAVTITTTDTTDCIHITTGNNGGDSFAQIRGDNEGGIKIRGGGSFEGGMIELAGGLRNTDPGILKFWAGTSGTPVQRMLIDASGNIGAPSGNNIYNASDERLKENLVELTDGLSKVNQLKPVSFTWKDGWSKSLEGVTQYGFSAQQTQTVDELLVEPFSDEVIELNGETIENPLRVNEKFLIPLLVKATQELSAKVAALESALNSKN